eukprot:6358887-Prymnesium_polylepis.1
MRAVTLTHTCIVTYHTVKRSHVFRAIVIHERAPFSARSNMSVGSCSWSTCNASRRGGGCASRNKPHLPGPQRA